MRGMTLRSKLALMFVSVCVATFGVGGYFVSASAKEALELEVGDRLEFQARAYATALDGRLDLLGSRLQDFASDGFIRDHAEALLEGDPRCAVLAGELQQHLVQNKLSIEPAFMDLAIVGSDGALVHTTGPSPTDLPRGPLREGSPWFSGWIPAGEEAPHPRIALGTPLHSREGRQPLGQLIAWVHPGVWIVGALQSSGFDSEASSGRPGLELQDARGQRLAVHPDLTTSHGPGTDSELVRSGFGLRLVNAQGDQDSADALHHSFPMPAAGWAVHVALPGEGIRAAVAGLQSRFMGFGAILSLVACVLFLLPMSFLTRPLQRLASAARRLAGGDLEVRVELDQKDEFGELASAFNMMAGAIEQRTHHLESTADALREGQEALAFERDRLRKVISSMRDGLVVLDPEGQLVVHNDAAEPLLEALRTERVELTSRHTCANAEEKRTACRTCLFSPDVGSRSCVVEIGGGVFEIHATRLAPDARGLSGRVLVSRDIGDRITQDERQIHQERLAVLGEVAAVMAHELNNPLAAISLYNQMLATELPQHPGLQENVEVIQRNVESCKRTIRDLLDYSNNQTPDLGAVDVNTTVEDVTGFLRLLRERSNVHIELDLAERSLEVNMDEIQLRQVFVNLLVNAIQAIGADGGEVRVATRAEEGYAVVDIHDTGAGIPEEARQKIFRPFYSTKERGEGTGLGLPTARRITEMHGGTLQLLDSSPRGSHFRVRLLLDTAPVRESAALPTTP